MRVDMRTIFSMAVLVGILCGCDPVTRYQISSTIFDGVPRMPPAEEYCREYHENALLKERETEKKKQLDQLKTEASSHPPYVEKRCDDCHDKTTSSGFITPLKDLCAACHTDFLKGSRLHGPAAVGACQKCHEPHSSPNVKLLTRPKAEICGGCHTEQRIAKGLHDNARDKGIFCTECHDPHAANNNYLLK
jgi:predicted CXXCH cytochrome family protein